MNRVSDTINKKAITHYNYPNDDKYAPILEFAKSMSSSKLFIVN